MRNALAIARKELSIYFTTPWAYAVFTAMAALGAFFFVSVLEKFQDVQDYARLVGWPRVPQEYLAYRNLTDGVIIQLWGFIMVVTVFVTPILSMRLFAEEKRHKTLELLMTSPVRPIEIVIGKYLGGLVVTGTTLGLTIAFPVLLSVFGVSQSGPTLEWSTVLLGYGGLLMWGAVCVAVGMFVSALTESQMLAALISIFVLLPWMLLDALASRTDEPFKSIINYLSFDSQLQNMLKGVLDLKALVFFGSVILFSLLLTHRTVEAQRWT